MIVDKFLQVSANQAVTATAASTDHIDTRAANRAIGDVTSLALVVSVSEAATAGGAATVTVEIQDSDNGTSGWATRATSGAVGKADLGAGAQVVVKAPSGLKRYVRANYTVGAGPLTGGKFSAQFVLDYNRQRAYPDGV